MSLLFDEPFVAVFPSLVRALDGDVAAAAVLQHIHFRSRSRETFTDAAGVTWFPVSRDDLADEIGITVKQVKRIIQKLRDTGYLTTVQMGGTDRRNFYSLSPEMGPSIGTKRADRSVPNGAVPLDPNGADVPLFNNSEEELQERTLVRKPIEAIDTEFDAFWAAYPRRDGKGHARIAWNKALRKSTPTAIISAAARYRDDPNREDGYTAMPTTWLNGERWLDGPLPGKTSRSDRKVTDIEGMISRAAQRDADRGRLELEA